MDTPGLIAVAESEVAMILKVLPPEILEHALTCHISYEPSPGISEGLEIDILGVFEGASIDGEPSPDAMPVIRIFVSNLWQFAGRDEQEYRDEIATTYLHELGHFLGWDEDQIAERGLA